MNNNLDSQAIQKLFVDGNYKLCILNNKNKYITKKFIENILKKYGVPDYRVKNLHLFQVAMTHVSYLNRTTITEKLSKILKDMTPIKMTNDIVPLQTTSYERLELLGDAFIHCIIAQYLYSRFQTDDEGFLTKLRSKLENSQMLSILSKKLGLPEYALIAQNIEHDNGRMQNTHLAEDIFESFCGALSQELSFENMYKFITNIIETDVDIAELINNNDNHKDTIMKYFHKQKLGVPKYVDVASVSPTPDSKIHVFTTNVVTSDGKIIGTGKGHSKIEAEQCAAENALINIGAITDEIVSDDFYGEISDCDAENDVYGYVSE